ncbi:PREDICTED: lachesin-like [Priapulus caudatus]|uniref:Lachesin-like n=1 Tax=Priapulus caudatus TaxID=37621 RepID=A0ABM1DXM0_PRICU|nr:PREDICTED: lachesin-like [Priapulus caudatus]
MNVAELLIVVAAISSAVVAQQAGFDDERRPAITWMSKDLVVDIGDAAKVECRVKNIGINTVVWMHIQQNGVARPLTSGLTRMIRDDRFNVRIEENGELYVLDIAEVREEDSGPYQCQITYSSPVYRNVMISIKRPPVIGEGTTRDLRVSENQTVVLTCSATGFPPPTLYWQKEDQSLLPTGESQHWNSTMIIDRITKEDRGIYVCVADNQVGDGDRRPVKVKVEFPPRIIIPKTRVGQAVNYGLNAELECIVEGFPAPVIQWFKDDKTEIVNNRDYQTSNFLGENDFTSSKLTAKRVRALHYGTYFCRAVNPRGSNEAAVSLYEVSVPSYEQGGKPVDFLGNSGRKMVQTISSVALLLLVAFLMH